MGDPRSFLNGVPVLGSLGSSIWGDPAEEKMQRALARAKAAYQARLPQVHQMYMNQNRNLMSAYQPYNQMMMKRYGTGAGIDFNKLLADPTPPGMNAPPAPKMRFG